MYVLLKLTAELVDSEDKASAFGYFEEDTSGQNKAYLDFAMYVLLFAQLHNFVLELDEFPT